MCEVNDFSRELEADVGRGGMSLVREDGGRILADESLG